MSATIAIVAARKSKTGAADARLIASAPDLLAGLKLVDDYFRDSRSSAEQYAAMTTQIKAAIAKAEGR